MKRPVLAAASVAVFCLSVAVILSSFSGSARAKGQDEKVLREMEAKFGKAVASRSHEAFLAFLAEDAAIFPTGKPVVVGKEAILKEWAPILDDPDGSLTWEPDKAEISASGDLGYTYGRYKYSGKGSDGMPVVRNGKYVTIWRKGSDGRWLVAVDLGTPSDPPPPKPAS